MDATIELMIVRGVSAMKWTKRDEISKRFSKVVAPIRVYTPIGHVRMSDMQ